QILKLADDEARSQKSKAHEDIARQRNDAQSEAEKIRTEAREQAERMLTAAQEQAERAITSARAEAEKTVTSARNEAEKTLTSASRGAGHRGTPARQPGRTPAGRTGFRPSRSAVPVAPGDAALARPGLIGRTLVSTGAGQAGPRRGRRHREEGRQCPAQAGQRQLRPAAP